MKIAVWKTGHEIADRVAQSLARGFDANIFTTGSTNDQECIEGIDAHIGYGILRGMESVFTESGRLGRHWFNMDRGYFNPGHFDGCYRISHRGTQLKWHEGIPKKPIDIKMEPWRTHGAYILICPPTDAVCEFFNISINHWLFHAGNEAVAMGCCPMIRQKDDSMPLENILPKTKAVITFNSSVGWKALQMGIPVLSDANHSAIGSFYKTTDPPTLLENLQNTPDNRMELFEAMNAHQFTLKEIERGEAWPLINHYLKFSSVGMDEKLSPVMSAPTALQSAPMQTLKSIFSNTAS